jgi:hypothetical protein
MAAKEHRFSASPCCREALDWKGSGAYPRCSSCHEPCKSVVILRRGGGRPEAVEKTVPIRLDLGALPGRRLVNYEPARENSRERNRLASARRRGEEGEA